MQEGHLKVPRKTYQDERKNLKLQRENELLNRQGIEICFSDWKGKAKITKREQLNEV